MGVLHVFYIVQMLPNGSKHYKWKIIQISLTILHTKFLEAFYQHIENTIVLTLKDPFISESCIQIKIELNPYFHTSLWCLKRFYEGL